MACAAAAESAAGAEEDSGWGEWAQPANDRQATRRRERMAPSYLFAPIGSTATEGAPWGASLPLRLLARVRRVRREAEHGVEVHHVRAVVRLEVRRLLEELRGARVVLALVQQD